MSRIQLIIVSIIFSTATILATPQAHAVQRAYVSALVGLDSNTSFNCDVARPCRFFQAATSVVDPNGEVVVLDSGGYGTVTLTQSIALIAPVGVYAGITVFPGTNGVTINTPGVEATLKGITINGMGGTDGVSFTQGAALRIQDCTISNMASNGLNATAPGAKVHVTDTTVRKNAASGIYLQGTVAALLQGVRAESNGYGVYARSGPTVDVRGSTAADNGGGGFTVEAATAASRMVVSNSSSVRNQTGIAMISATGRTLTLTVVDSVIEGNGFYGISDSNSAGGSVLTVESSKIVHNGYGHISGAGIQYGNAPGGDARYAVLSKNLIADNSYFGVLLQGTSSTIVLFSGNTVTQNQSGIYTLYGTGFTFPIKYSRGDNTIGFNFVSNNSSDTSSGVAMTPLGAL